MELKDLYAQYGELMVKAEILNQQIGAVKSAINDELKKPKLTDTK